MSIFDDSFKPVNVASSRNRFGEEEDKISDAVDSLASSAPAVSTTAPEQPQTPTEEPAPVVDSGGSSAFDGMFEPVVDEEVPTEAFDSMFVPDVEEATASIPPSASSFDDMFSAEPSTPLDLSAQSKEMPHDEYRRLLLPDTIEAGTYSPNDLAERDDTFEIIKTYMQDRYGLQAIEDQSREDIVEMFLNNRRGVAMSGNSVRVVSEMDYLADIRENETKLKNAGAAYLLYEEMQGITDDEYTWGETGWATLDVLRGVAADPVTWLSAGIGKVVAGAGTKATTQATERIVARMIQEQVRQGVSRQTIRANATNMYRQAAQQAAIEGTEDIARFAAQQSLPGLQRLTTRQAITEVGVTTAVDAAAGAGTEFLYQRGLIETGVQEEVNRYAVGLAALGSLVVGGASAGMIARRGSSGTALPTESIQAGNPHKAATDLQESIRTFYTQDVEANVSWADKIGSGGELNVQDTDFFIDFLLGSSMEGAGEDGADLAVKGLAQVMQENGFFYVKRTDEDSVSNFVADFIKEEMDPEDVAGVINAFEEATGTKLTGFVDDAGEPITGAPTPEQFANAFARKMHDQARGLNAASQVARRLDINIEDLDIETFLKDQLGMLEGPKTRVDAFSERFSNTLTQTVANAQNRYIRALVSHVGTSKLNVLGWGVSSGMGSANDLVRGLGLATRASYNRAIGNVDKARSDAHMSQAILSANLNRVNLMLDPNMTAAAFNSAVQRSAGPLGQLGRVQSGGVDVGASVDQLINRTAAGRAADAYVEGAQFLTLVRAQDTFTKSQQYVFEMDKALRANFGRSWNEFYNAEDVNQLMATREYRLLEEQAVANTLEHTFSTSFQGTGLLGEMAGVMENIRNVPGLGMMIPFGKFFNNTVHFTAKNTPGLNQFMKAFGGQFKDKTHGELFTQSAIASGLVYSYALTAQEDRSKGLGLYETMDPNTGEVITREYDYPLSLFMAAGHIASYHLAGEEVPPELVQRTFEDFGLTGVTRNLDTSTQGVVDAVTLMLSGELAQGASDLGGETSAIGAQALAGFTRPLEGPDTLMGVLFGHDMRPLNTKEGNRFTGKALMYMDNTVNILTGGPDLDVRVGAATGEADPVTAKQLGVRNVMLTNTMRVMNMLEIETWDENASFAVSEMAADVGNEYNRVFFRNIEEVAELAMADETFRTLPLSQQQAIWKDTIESIRETTRNQMAFNSTMEGSTFSDQLYIIEKFRRQDILSAMDELELGDEIGELDTIQIDVLKSYLDSIDEIELYERPTRSWER